MTAATYRDRWINCADSVVAIRGYYFPWGTKRIPYDEIRSIRKVKLSAARGRGRLWGTANPRYWASLDPTRPGKQTGVILDLGHFVHPFLTPDDPEAFAAAVHGHAPADPPGRGPLI